MQVNATEFRQHLFDYLSQLPQHPIELTLRGKVIAHISPVEDSQKQAKIRLKLLRKTAVIQGDLNVSHEFNWSADADDLIGY